MAEAEHEIISGVIEGALKAARTTSKAAHDAEQQIEALAAITSFAPTDEDLSNVPVTCPHDRYLAAQLLPELAHRYPDLIQVFL